MPVWMSTPHPRWVFSLVVLLFLVGEFSHCRNPIAVLTFYLVPNLPTQTGVLTVPLLVRLCLCFYPKDWRLTFFQWFCVFLKGFQTGSEITISSNTWRSGFVHGDFTGKHCLLLYISTIVPRDLWPNPLLLLLPLPLLESHHVHPRLYHQENTSMPESLYWIDCKGAGKQNWS